MLENGLLEETKRLVERGLLTGTAAQAIGFLKRSTLKLSERRANIGEECTELLKRRSKLCKTSTSG